MVRPPLSTCITSRTHDGGTANRWAASLIKASNDDADAGGGRRTGERGAALMVVSGAHVGPGGETGDTLMSGLEDDGRRRPASSDGMLIEDTDAGGAVCPWRAADMSESTAEAATAALVESLTMSIAASLFR